MICPFGLNSTVPIKSMSQPAPLSRVSRGQEVVAQFLRRDDRRGCVKHHDGANRSSGGGRGLTVKLRGRALAFPARRERRIMDGARGAHSHAPHGPLQRLLDGGVLVRTKYSIDARLIARSGGLKPLQHVRI
jgi:hypothetical protein